MTKKKSFYALDLDKVASWTTRDIENYILSPGLVSKAFFRGFYGWDDFQFERARLFVMDELHRVGLDMYRSDMLPRGDLYSKRLEVQRTMLEKRPDFFSHRPTHAPAWFTPYLNTGQPPPSKIDPNCVMQRFILDICCPLRPAAIKETSRNDGAKHELESVDNHSKPQLEQTASYLHQSTTSRNLPNTNSEFNSRDVDTWNPASLQKYILATFEKNMKLPKHFCRKFYGWHAKQYLEARDFTLSELEKNGVLADGEDALGYTINDRPRRKVQRAMITQRPSLFSPRPGHAPAWFTSDVVTGNCKKKRIDLWCVTQQFIAHVHYRRRGKLRKMLKHGMEPQPELDDPGSEMDESNVDNSFNPLNVSTWNLHDITCYVASNLPKPWPFYNSFYGWTADECKQARSFVQSQLKVTQNDDCDSRRAEANSQRAAVQHAMLSQRSDLFRNRHGASPPSWFNWNTITSNPGTGNYHLACVTQNFIGDVYHRRQYMLGKASLEQPTHQQASLKDGVNPNNSHGEESSSDDNETSLFMPDSSYRSASKQSSVDEAIRKAPRNRGRSIERGGKRRRDKNSGLTDLNAKNVGQADRSRSASNDSSLFVPRQTDGPVIQRLLKAVERARHLKPIGSQAKHGSAVRGRVASNHTELNLPDRTHSPSIDKEMHSDPLSNSGGFKRRKTASDQTDGPVIQRLLEAVECARHLKPIGYQATPEPVMGSGVASSHTGLNLPDRTHSPGTEIEIKSEPDSDSGSIQADSGRVRGRKTASNHTEHNSPGPAVFANIGRDAQPAQATVPRTLGASNQTEHNFPDQTVPAKISRDTQPAQATVPRTFSASDQTEHNFPDRVLSARISRDIQLAQTTIPNTFAAQPKLPDLFVYIVRVSKQGDEAIRFDRNRYFGFSRVMPEPMGGVDWNYFLQRATNRRTNCVDSLYWFNSDAVTEHSAPPWFIEDEHQLQAALCRLYKEAPIDPPATGIQIFTAEDPNIMGYIPKPEAVRMRNFAPITVWHFPKVADVVIKDEPEQEGQRGLDVNEAEIAKAREARTAWEEAEAMRKAWEEAAARRHGRRSGP